MCLDEASKILEYIYLPKPTKLMASRGLPERVVHAVEPGSHSLYRNQDGLPPPRPQPPRIGWLPKLGAFLRSQTDRRLNADLVFVSVGAQLYEGVLLSLFSLLDLFLIRP